MAPMLTPHPGPATIQGHVQSMCSKRSDSNYSIRQSAPLLQSYKEPSYVHIGPIARKRDLSEHASPSARSNDTPSNTPDLTRCDPVEETSWFSDYDIPDELQLLTTGVPEQIRNLIRESIDQYRALKASTLESIAQEPLPIDKDVKKTTKHHSGTDLTTALAISISAESTGSDSSSGETTASSDRSSLSYHSTNTSLSIRDNPLTANSNEHMVNQPGRGMESQESLGSEMSNGANSSGERDRKHRKRFRLPSFLPPFKGKAKVLPKSGIIHLLDDRVECTGCMDDIPRATAVRMSCQCHYCTTCFNQMVKTATQNEAMFPPKCCLQEVPKDTIRLYLSYKDYAHFLLKTKEYAVPAERRWYCTSPACGKWILVPSHRLVFGSVKCTYCQYDICAHCRGPAHKSNQECPRDRSLEATLEQAEREGWRRCYKCRAMVELATGCRHVTCRCKAEFCYICGAKWRTCACTETDHAQRRTEVRERRQRFDAVAQAEEEEVRAAIAAVAAAEREEEKKRIAEEAAREQQAQRREQQRLEGISDYYRGLAQTLKEIHTRQRDAIVSRHRSFAETQEQASFHQVEEECLTRKLNTIAKSQGDLIDLRHQHTMAIAEVNTRHREQLENLNLELDQACGKGQSNIGNALSRLRSLIKSQEQEISILTRMQIRKIQLHRDRGKKAWENVNLSSDEQKARHHGEHERTKQNIARQVFADWKWFDRISEERTVMLEEDQRRCIELGADAPTAPGPSSAPARLAIPAPLPAIYIADPVPRRSPFQGTIA